TSGYNGFNDRTSLSDNLGGVVTYTFDSNHEMLTASLQVSGVQGPQVALGYDANERVTSIARTVTTGGPSVSTSLGYDSENRITSIVHTNASGTTLSSLSYHYDAAGQLTIYTGGGLEGWLNLGYDATGELTSVTTGQSASYSYDLAGNRTMTGFTTGPDNRLTSDGTYNYTYDNE